MRAVRTRDTAPELALRSALHRRGLRFRVDRPPVLGIRCRADLVFVGARVAVFVDGCFWHGCPLHRSLPKANSTWWKEKLGGTQRRDRETSLQLATAGWVVIRVWEHQDAEEAARLVGRVVLERIGRLPNLTSEMLR